MSDESLAADEVRDELGGERQPRAGGGLAAPGETAVRRSDDENHPLRKKGGRGSVARSLARQVRHGPRCGSSLRGSDSTRRLLKACRRKQHNRRNLETLLVTFRSRVAPQSLMLGSASRVLACAAVGVIGSSSDVYFTGGRTCSDGETCRGRPARRPGRDMMDTKPASPFRVEVNSGHAPSRHGHAWMWAFIAATPRHGSCCLVRVAADSKADRRQLRRISRRSPRTKGRVPVMQLQGNNTVPVIISSANAESNMGNMPCRLAPTALQIQPIISAPFAFIYRTYRRMHPARAGGG
ncbi:hypothetical protein RJ55_07680 [Drechmeria coniospora]|nr:hypothetical protein RJ55_07680 [Drechmeria coniospora]